MKSGDAIGYWCSSQQQQISVFWVTCRERKSLCKAKTDLCRFFCEKCSHVESRVVVTVPSQVALSAT